MNRHENPVIRRIVSFIGIDYNLIKKSGEDNIARFYLSGIFVLLIFALSFFSVSYAFDLMFHKWYAEVLLATFFSFTFLTIYLLLIQTFSKETLPASYKVTFFSTSNITRICFVLMISFLIAQPIKIFLLSDELDHDILVYKDNLYQSFLSRTNQLYQKDLTKLNKQRLWYEELDLSGEEAKKVNDKIMDIEATMKSDQDSAQARISNADFFLKRITIANKYWQSWLTCFIVIVIFSTPVYLIYSISDNSKYYTEKRNQDHDLVLREYDAFKARYISLFKERYNRDVQLDGGYDDPPFNKIKKPVPVYLKTSDLTERIMTNGL
jgi:hypothetical protein